MPAVSCVWQPSASLSALRHRAQLLARLRQFFAERQVLEVETPLLCRFGVTDPYLDNLSVELPWGGRRWLQTSPEYAMKRLLAAGSGAIYQIGKAFRPDELGRHHNPEFTMLEWYRPGFDEHQLMAEVTAVVQLALGALPITTYTYRDAFLNFLQIDPFMIGGAELAAITEQRLALDCRDLNRDQCLHALQGLLLEPALAQLPGLVYIHQFPASQAALAQRQQDAEGHWVGRRFELYIQGLELANGYFELTDPLLQQRRFDEDNALRIHEGKPVREPDPYLLAALEAGLPSCAGVALGFDRLLMLALKAAQLSEVISFSADRI